MASDDEMTCVLEHTAGVSKKKRGFFLTPADPRKKYPTAETKFLRR